MMLVPRPLSSTIGGPAVTDTALLAWCSKLVRDVYLS